MKYEVVREIFNMCDRNKMRDIFIEEKEVEDPDAYVREYCEGKNASIEDVSKTDGTRIFYLDISGMRQKFTFTPVE